MKKNLVLWLLALLLTLGLAVYQRLSGPTHPLRGREAIQGVRVEYKFLRSWTSHAPLPVRVAGDGLAALRLYYRRYPLVPGEEWSFVQMVTRDGAFQAEVPGQPAAGKMAYKVLAVTAAGADWLNTGVPVLVRFKDEVPAWLLLLHILFMFAGLLLAFRAGLGALFNDGPKGPRQGGPEGPRRGGPEGPGTGGGWRRLVPWTLAVTVVGGLILGPIVQKYAFGAFWTGFPLGSDLTDTKMLLAALVWLTAFFKRKKGRWWTVLATVLMVGVYLIPHSLFGSELDYKTGKIITAR